MSGESPTAEENPKLISRMMSKGSGEGSSRNKGFAWHAERKAWGERKQSHFDPEIRDFWEQVPSCSLVRNSEANRAAGELVRTWKVQIGRSKTATEDCCRWKLASAYTLAVMVGVIKKLGKKRSIPSSENGLAILKAVSACWLVVDCIPTEAPVADSRVNGAAESDQDSEDHHGGSPWMQV